MDNSPLGFDDRLLEELADVLEGGGVPVIAKERIADGGLLRVGDAEDQLRGSALLRDHLNPPGEERQFVVALNLASTTPEWLKGIGGEPMALGLDLKGGAHFVLQVDMEEALAKRLTDEVEKIKDMLREERLRYRSTANAVQGEVIRMGFATAELRNRAMATVEEEFREPDYLLAQADVADRPGFEITVQEAKIDEIESNAIEQNLTGLRNRINQLGVAEPLVQKLGGSRHRHRSAGRPGRCGREAQDQQVRQPRVPARGGGGRPPVPRSTSGCTTAASCNSTAAFILTGDRVVHAAQGRDPETGLPQVNVRVDSQGGEMIHDATAPNIGRAMAVIFIEHKPIVTVEEVDGKRMERHSSRADKRVISLATIQAALPHSFRITGLELRDAQELAFLLLCGCLGGTDVHRRGAYGGRHARRGEHRAPACWRWAPASSWCSFSWPSTTRSSASSPTSR